MSSPEPAVPALAVAEATCFVGRRLGADAEGRFLRGIGTRRGGPSPEDFSGWRSWWGSTPTFPLGGTDASVIALAERLGARMILTLDRRHFAAVAPRDGRAFELPP